MQNQPDPVVDAPPLEKAYCCGNSTQREAGLIAKFDLIFSLVFLSIVLSILIIITSSPDYFPDIVKNAPGNITTDLSVFLEWSRGAQISVLSLSVVLHIAYIVLSLLLLISARRRIHKLLLIWFGSTIVIYSLGTILTIVCIFFLHDKVAMSVGLIFIFLYKLYSLWIVKILMREITSVSGSEVYGDDLEIEDAHENDGLNPAIPLDKF